MVFKHLLLLEELVYCIHINKCLSDQLYFIFDVIDHQISRMHARFSEEKWILDQSSIFAQVDAFVQRCKDLLEVRSILHIEYRLL